MRFIEKQVRRCIYDLIKAKQINKKELSIIVSRVEFIATEILKEAENLALSSGKSWLSRRDIESAMWQYPEIRKLIIKYPIPRKRIRYIRMDTVKNYMFSKMRILTKSHFKKPYMIDELTVMLPPSKPKWIRSAITPAAVNYFYRLLMYIALEAFDFIIKRRKRK